MPTNPARTKVAIFDVEGETKILVHETFVSHFLVENRLPFFFLPPVAYFFVSVANEKQIVATAIPLSPPLSY